MSKIKQKKEVTEKSESEHSEDFDDEFSEHDESQSEDSDEEQYDSMIENGTSDSATSDESDNENPANSATDDENQDSGHSESKIEVSRKRKQNAPLAGPVEKAKKTKEDTKLYKQPTVEEINQLRETENLFHSNLFRMQIDEMLNEVRIKDKYKLYSVQWLDEFNTFLETLKSMPEKEDSTNISFLKKCKVKVPINMVELQPTKFQFQFLTPQEKAFLIGSAETHTWVGSKITADICVPMPANCFQKENYLNLIYDQKRALYLTFIANQMIKKGFHSNDLKFNYVHNNPYKPVLEIVPDGKIGKKLNFRIYVAGDCDSFKLNRFVPWNSNIRGCLFGEKVKSGIEDIPLATPNYNATVLFDLTMKRNQEVINETFGEHKNLKEGLILLKVWLRQRRLEAGFCGFGNHLMALFVVYLFKERKIHASMSSYQVARNVWNNLALSSWNVPNKGITLCSITGQPNQPTLEQFHTHYDVVFVDSTGYLNLCANLSVDIYLTIKYESQRALDLLNNTKVNSFQALFMQTIPVYTKFDHFIKISDENVINRVIQKMGKRADLHNFAGMWYPQIINMICRVIRKGLGERILSLAPIEDSSKFWKPTESPPKKKKLLKIGLVLNREAACELLDKGPQANDPTAAEFREFWGEKSQLRRFQDGSITEACVWAASTDTTAKKRLIVKKIVEYLLFHRFKILRNELYYIAGQFDAAYSLDKLFYVVQKGSNNAENTALSVIQKFDEVAKKLRACDDLPLEITSVQGISSVFRYCDSVPLLNGAKHYEEFGKTIFQSYKICRGVIQLGLSGKWPNDLPAFRRIKTAFHIQIARKLREKFKLITRGDINGVFILNDGYLFKVEIFHPKEIALMKKTTSVKGVVQYVDTEESLEFEKRLNVLPKLTSTLHGLYQRYTSFGPTVMIAKRWLYSQLLDPYLWPDECTELLIASQFLKEDATQNAVQPQTGFFRFLEMLANFDFQAELVLLNFNDEMNRDDVTNIESRFTTERDEYPPLSIITSFDTNQNCIWSTKSPSRQILARVVLLARHALKQIEPAFTDESELPLAELFIACLDGYDLVITLNPSMVRSCYARNFLPVTSTTFKVDATIPAAEFDPVQKGLQELRNAYSDFAIFFFNPAGGKHIAVIWKPECFSEREFKVGNVNGCAVDENGVVKCNVKQLIEDFKITLKALYHKFTDLREERLNGS